MSHDKIAALYVYCMNYHSGQSSRLYRLLSKLSTQYKVKLTDNAIENIVNNYDDSWIEAHLIYQQLENNWSKY